MVRVPSFSPELQDLIAAGKFGTLEQYVVHKTIVPDRSFAAIEVKSKM